MTDGSKKVHVKWGYRHSGIYRQEEGVSYLFGEGFTVNSKRKI